jgi:hypothetical protein
MQTSSKGPKLNCLISRRMRRPEEEEEEEEKEGEEEIWAMRSWP